jgi:hypothetical protein
VSDWQSSRVRKYDEETIGPSKRGNIVNFFVKKKESEDWLKKHAYLFFVENEQLVREKLESLQELFNISVSPLSVTKE